jgi:hypothetical protein
MNNARKVIAGLMLALLVLAVWPLTSRSQQENDQARLSASNAPERGNSSARREAPTARVTMSDEEKLVRDVYARLMRYQSAAMDELTAREDKASAPEDYLTFELRDIRSGPVAEVWNRPLADLVTERSGALVSLKPTHLRDGGGPVYAYYAAQWATLSDVAERSDARPSKGQDAKTTVGQMLHRGGESLEGINRYTSYEVTVHLNGKQRTYRALALYQLQSSAEGHSQTEQNHGARPARVEMLDNITQGMSAVYNDESPLVRSPWKRYVKSGSYLAVARTIKQSKLAGKPLIPADAPIGYLPGDDIAPSETDRKALASSSLATTSTCATGISKIQYQSGSTFTDVPGTLYVLKGTSVTFKAIPDPANGTFADGQPVWSGTSGATGTGDTISITFNAVSTSTSDFKTVVATAGNSVTVNVIVYELTPVTTPRDNFSGRSATDYGLKELIDLSFTTSPNVTAAQAGGLDWSKKSGVGTVTPSSGSVGTGTYDAEGTAGAVTLSIKVVSGPSTGQERTVDRNIVAPNDATMTQAAGTGIRHIQDYISVGFKGSIFLSPKNVSFANINWREGTVSAVGSGCWASENGNAHPIGSSMTVSGCNTTTGCQVNAIDTVQAGDRGPYPPPNPAYCSGDFEWDIPWQYSADGGTNWVSFTTAVHHQWAETAPNLGRANIQKKGAGPFSRHATDPTTQY